MAKKITLSAYARHRGLNVKTIRDAIDQGQITVTKKDGNVWIDKEQADIEWEQNRTTKGSIKGNIDYANARAIREKANAEKAVLELAELKSKLVRVEDVEKEAYETHRDMRNGVLTIPNKVSAILASMQDPHEIEIFLTKEIHEALTRLSQGKYGQNYVP